MKLKQLSEADTSSLLPQFLVDGEEIEFTVPEEVRVEAKALGNKSKSKRFLAVSEGTVLPETIWFMTEKYPGEKGKAWAKSEVEKLKNKKESTHVIKSQFNFKEASNSKGRRLEAELIEEGLGNLGTVYYYPGATLARCAKNFEGVKAYADHPSMSEEQDRPERTVRDIIGYYENVRAENRDGRIKLVADLVIPEDPQYDWARALMREAIQYKNKHPDKELIGLSINSSGDSEERELDEFLASGELVDAAREKLMKAKEQGISKIKFVTDIFDAVSVDLVTEAGAGGKIIKIMEGDKSMSKKTKVVENDEEKKKADGADAGKDHADAAQDKALIADMLKKHVGDKEECSDEEMEGMHQMHQALVDEGHESEEAAKISAASYKASKKMKMKKEAEEKAKQADAVVADPDSETDDAMDNEESKKESATVIKLQGRIALLEREAKLVKLEKHIENKLAESKLPKSVTSDFRKLIGDVKAMRSEKEFDEKLALFMEGYKNKEEDSSFFSFAPEKAAAVDAGTEELSLADAVN